MPILSALPHGIFPAPCRLRRTIHTARMNIPHPTTHPTTNSPIITTIPPQCKQRSPRLCHPPLSPPLVSKCPIQPHLGPLHLPSLHLSHHPLQGHNQPRHLRACHLHGRDQPTPHRHHP